MIPRYIACVGSRETPHDVLAWMEKLGAEIVRRGHCIITGNAPGADQAWARGGNSVDPSKVYLRLPWYGFESHAIRPENNVLTVGDLGAEVLTHCMRVAATQHKRWAQLSPAAQKLHARNVMIVEPATFVLGSLNPGKLHGGGTGMAFQLARALGIRTVNVRSSEWASAEKLVQALPKETP